MPVPRRTQVRNWLHDVCRDTADAARKALRGRSPGKTVRQGASGSPTSALDATAERVLIQRLRDAPVPMNLLSEEIGYIATKGAEWTLVADPVDGTRNALRGIPINCVSLAVGRNDLSGVEMGIVHTIPTGQDYWAERGRGATLDGKRIRPAKVDPDEVLLGMALDWEDNLRVPRGPNVHFRDLGSSAMEMCYVAQGVLDGFLTTQPLLRVIDIAASTLILREAGGIVQNLDRTELNVPYNLKVRFPLVALGHASTWRHLR